MAWHGRSEETFRRGAALLKALSHPVRLQIVALLRHDEACVCHLQAVLGRRQPYISQQLMTLREAGLVEDRRDGAIVNYRLVCVEIEPVLGWVQAELARQGLAVPIMEPPPLPVDDCPCPKCARERERLGQGGS